MMVKNLLQDCFNDCKLDGACKYWTFNLDTNVCKWYEHLQINSYLETANFVTGEKFCAAATRKDLSTLQ